MTITVTPDHIDLNVDVDEIVVTVEPTEVSVEVSSIPPASVMPFSDAGFTATNVQAAIVEAKSSGGGVGTVQSVAGVSPDPSHDIPEADLASALNLGSAASHAASDFDASGAAASALSTAEAYTDTQVGAEASTRANADTTNANAISAETTRATAAEGTNASAITSEASTRASADTAEASARAAADALLAPIASPTFTGITTAPEFSASGLTGALAGARWVGATSSGAPTAGTFAVGDYVIDRTGNLWICTVAGTPGTWVNPTTAVSTQALEFLLTETVNYRPNTVLNGNTSVYIQQNETLGILPAVSSITASGTAWTITFGSSILGTFGKVGDTFEGQLNGFGRIVTDLHTTNTSTTITSATAAFVAGDVGAVVTGTNIPNDTVISSVTNSTTVVINHAATGTTSTGTLRIFRSDWNVGTAFVPVTFTVASSTTATYTSAVSPAAPTMLGRLEAIPQQYANHFGPPGILQIDGTNTFSASVSQLNGIGPVIQNSMTYFVGTVNNFSCTVANGSNVLTIAGDQRGSIALYHKAVIPTGTPPVQDTTKLPNNAWVASISYDGTNTIVNLGVAPSTGIGFAANYVGSNTTETVYFVPDITTGEFIVNGPITEAAHGVPVSFPISTGNFAAPGEGQGWSGGYWHNPVFSAFSSASRLINVQDVAFVATSFFNAGTTALQRLGIYVADCATSRSSTSTGTVAKQIGLILGTMSADTTDYLPYVAATTAGNNVGFLQPSTTVFLPAPAVAYVASGVTLTTSGQTVTFDTNMGFSSAGGSLVVPGGSTLLSYTGTTGSTQLTGVKVSSGTLALTAGQAVMTANHYQDVSAGTFTVQAYGTTAALSSTTSVSATTAAAVISTGAPLYAGQVLRILNVSGAGVSLTFTGGTTPGLQLGAGRRVVGSGGFLELQWSSTLSLWIEVAYAPGDAAGAPFADMGTNVANATSGNAGAETSLLSTGAAVAGVFETGAVGKSWEIVLSGNQLNNSGTATTSTIYNVYFGSYVVDTFTYTTASSNATSHEWGYKIRLTVETVGAGGVGTLRISGERWGIDTILGVGTGWQKIPTNVLAARAAESTGTNANLVTNAPQAFNVTATVNSGAAALSTAANLKATLTECRVHAGV